MHNKLSVKKHVVYISFLLLVHSEYQIENKENIVLIIYQNYWNAEVLIYIYKHTHTHTLVKMCIFSQN